MKTDSVWVSDLPNDGSNVEIRLSHDPEEPGRKAMLSEGRDPTADELPITTFEKYADGPIDDLPPIFDGAGGLAISGELAAPILNFNLRRTLLLPLRILKHDRKTEILADRKYHIFLAYQIFEVLAEHDSPNLRHDKKYSPPQWRRLPRKSEDGDVAVHMNALDSPAVWGDPAFRGSKFFNGEVVSAIEASGTAKHWHFKKCRIVDRAHDIYRTPSDDVF